MRVRSAVRRMCRDCYVVKKKRVVYIRCKSVKKHKQRQGFHTDAAMSLGERGNGFGPCACGGRLCCSSSTTAVVGSPLATRQDTLGALATLPWLPEWASAAKHSNGSSGCASSDAQARRSSKLSSPAELALRSPLQALAQWGYSFLACVWGTQSR